jgi:uncharacterized protein YyaL (SSP411 family)
MSSTGQTADFRFSPRPNRADEIRWRSWGDDVFREAQTAGKPVLLSLSAVWCHWCHVMDETTYSDRRVIELINNRFIPTRVDNDRRPDVNRRYNMGGWPTTAFLTETGDVITGATYLPVDTMLDALRRVDEVYGKQRQELVQRGAAQRAATLRQLRAAAQAEERERMDAAPPELDAETAAADTEPAAGPRSPLADTLGLEPEELEWATGVVADVREQASLAFDAVNGGFGSEPKFPQAEVLSFLLLRLCGTTDERLDEIVTTTLDHMADGDMYDRAENGFFRYSTQRDWTAPHYEKMLEDNARLARVYLDAAALHRERGGDHAAAAAHYGDVARGILEYLDTVLWSPVVGAYAGSQDADEHYYSLDLDARRDLGTTPFVDPTVYTDWNALAARALVKAAIVLDRPDHAERAEGLLDTLWDAAHGRHAMGHYLIPQSGELVGGPVDGMLGDQASVAAALLDAYEWSGRRTHLARAEMLSDWVDEHLSAPGGALFDRLRSVDAAGLLALPRVALDESAAMADVWLRLAAYTGDRRYRRRAARLLASLRSLVDRYGLLAAPVAATLTRFLEPQIHVIVVGDGAAAETQALRRAALRLAAPQRTVQVLDADHDLERLVRDGFALDGPPQAFVCRGTTCQAPTTDPDGIATVMAVFAASDEGTVGVSDVRAPSDEGAFEVADVVAASDEVAASTATGAAGDTSPAATPDADDEADAPGGAEGAA